MKRAILTVAALALSGCLMKASWVPNDHGGYTLMTQAGSMDQALTRFRRTAKDLCGSAPYSMTEPAVTGRGWSFSAGSGGAFGGTNMTVRSELACR